MIKKIWKFLKTPIRKDIVDFMKDVILVLIALFLPLILIGFAEVELYKVFTYCQVRAIEIYIGIVFVSFFIIIILVGSMSKKDKKKVK